MIQLAQQAKVSFRAEETKMNNNSEDESQAYWLYHRCAKARSEMQTPYSTLEFSLKILQVIKSLSIEDVENNYDIQQNLFKAIKDGKKRDFSFVFDVIDRLLDLKCDESLTEDALREVAANDSIVGERPVFLKKKMDENSARTSSTEKPTSPSIHDTDGNIDEEIHAPVSSVKNDLVRNPIFVCSADRSKESEFNDCSVTSQVPIDSIQDCSNMNSNELFCFQLRTRVLGLSLPVFTTKLWKYLQMAGWMYISGIYHAPKAKRLVMWSEPEVLVQRVFSEFNLDHTDTSNISTVDSDDDEGPDTFRSSNDIVEYLDQYCLPECLSATDGFNARQELVTKKSRAYELKAKRLRNEVLEIAFGEREHDFFYDVGVKTLSTYDHNHRVCDVCFKGAHPVYSRVACRDCGLVVHTKCYGLIDYNENNKCTIEKTNIERQKVDEKGFFQCDVCEIGSIYRAISKKELWNAPLWARWRAHSVFNVSCALCMSQLIAGGMVKILKDVAKEDSSNKILDKRSKRKYECWVHLFCFKSLTGNEIDYLFRSSSDAINQILSVIPISEEIRCFCSKQRKGLIVRCNGNCGSWFHPICLQLERLKEGVTSGVTNMCSNCAHPTDDSFSVSNNVDMTYASDRQSKLSNHGESDSNSYFIHNSKRKRLKLECDEGIVTPSLNDFIAEAKAVHDHECTKDDYTHKFELFDTPCCEMYREWAFMLATSQSVLLYGLGSKRFFLESFGEMLSTKGDVLSINGYDSDFSLNEFLDMMIRLLIDECQLIDHESKIDFSKPHRSKALVKKAAFIAQHFTGVRPLFIMVHSIDGVSLRSIYAQDALATLTANSRKDGFPMIRIAASVDNVNSAMLLWTPQTERKFDWIWKLVHSYHPYFQEIEKGSYDSVNKDEVINAQKAQKSSASVKNVLRSIAPRHTEVVKLLATLQRISCMNGVTYATLRENCMKNLIISSDAKLRNILKELIDHGIVRFGKNDNDQDPSAVVYIPLEMISEIHGLRNIFQ